MRMYGSRLVAVCLVFMLGVQQSLQQTEEEKLKRFEVTSPPKITEHPKQEEGYKEGDPVQLTCTASGNPRPRFYWKKNGEAFEVDGERVEMLDDKGTLSFLQPDVDDEAIYQCYAENDLGRALSMKSQLKQAKADPFATRDDIPVHEPDVGDYLMLSCEPPYSYPAGLVYWGVNNPGDKFTAVDQTERIALDYDGNLHFANILESDTLEEPDSTYICISENTELRTLVQGDDKIIKVNADKEADDHLPQLRWSSESPTVGLNGSFINMKCIYSGKPTPQVKWRRIGKPLQAKADDSCSFGQELHIPDLTSEDSGEYECYAMMGTSPREYEPQRINLTVQSPPFWVQKPTDRFVPDKDEATFTCIAGGIPKPTVQWTRNGEPLSNFPNAVISPDGETVTYNSVEVDDAGTLQCNASNANGYTFTNAYLNVLTSREPSFITMPPKETKVAEGKSVLIACEVFGVPRPDISWYKDEDQLLGDRFIIDTSTKIAANLTIKKAEMNDTGTYKCAASNEVGADEAEGTLLVREATVILEGPSEQTFNASEDFTLPCRVYTDPEEEENLNITWYIYDEPIDFDNEPRFKFNADDFSLTVLGAKPDDTGDFKCVATNGLDTVESVATITVQDRPDPPLDVWLQVCGATSIEVHWYPGSDNNAPITGYLIYYNTSFMEPGEYTELPPVPADEMMIKMKPSPWTNYTFHVRAENQVGLSEPSRFTGSVCETPPDVPYTNPANVCSESRGSDEVIITWTTMPKSEHNGGDFHYLVVATKVETGETEQVEINNWRQSEVSIPSDKPFAAYKVVVHAKNQMGLAPDSSAEKILAFSGEEAPTVVPEDFGVIDDSVEDTSANFSWTAVDENNADVIRGFFTGYRVMYWRASDPDNKRHQDLIMDEFDPCPPAPENRKKRQAGGAGEQERQLQVTGLWPFEDIQAGILVMNNGKQGMLSDPPFSFRTKQGPPGPAQLLEVVETGSYYIKIRWLPPRTLNGILAGYQIQYQRVDALGGPGDTVNVADPTQLTLTLEKLEPDTEYIIQHFSITAGGLGLPELAQGQTKPMMPPDKPGVAQATYDDGDFNVTIVPTEKSGDKDSNPGNDFYVVYRRKGADDWNKIEVPPGQNWVNFSAEEGEDYEVVVVAVSGYDDDAMETRSDPKVVTAAAGPEEEAVEQPIARAGWFWGMLLVILLLLIILLIICILLRKRGGKYPVYEKEKLLGKGDDEEEPFSPYYPPTSDTSPPPYTDLDKPALPPSESGSDDSLAEYEDTDPSKFNEDGSFIGQYGGSKVTDNRPDQSNALSSVV